MNARVERPGPMLMGWVLVLGIAAGLGSCSGDDEWEPRIKARPELYLVVPATGSATGGDSVTIFTMGFRDNFVADPPVVTFGGLPARIISVASPAEMYVEVPPGGGPGPVDVTVEAQGQAQTATCKGCFVYTPAMLCMITGISPDTGDVGGGGPITITGAYFGGSTPPPRVHFGTEEAWVVWRGPQELEVHAPPAAMGQPGWVDVIVSPAGQAPCIRPDGYLYTPNPCRIFGVTPRFGHSAGGEPLTIQGQGFESGSTVYVGSAPATNVVVDPSGESITCTTPAVTVSGWTGVAVMGPFSACSLSHAYYYIPAGGCLAWSVEPSVGIQAGGESIRIHGHGFESTPPPLVEFVGTGPPVPSPGVIWIDGNTLEVITPAWPGVGDVDVRVTNTVAGLDCTLIDGFRFIGPGQCGLYSVTPSSGGLSGGYDATLLGAGLSPTPVEILFGSTPVDPGTIRWIDPTTVIVEVPPSIMEAMVDVTYVNPGPEWCSLANGFEYVGPSCTITGVIPPLGPRTGGTWIEIHGTDFPADARVYFGGIQANPYFTTVTPTRITTISPGILNPDCVSICVIGTGADCCLPDGFCYESGCTVTDITPSSGPMTGRDIVTITGDYFDPQVFVRFDTLFSPRTSVISSTEIQAETPPGLQPGLVDVKVLGNAAMQCLATQAYEYLPGPGGGGCTITSLSPSSGSPLGGERVVVRGSGFDPGPPAPGVVFGLVPGENVVWLNASNLEVYTPPALYLGAVDVHVVNANGDVCTAPDGFTYNPLPPCPTVCTLASVFPSSGPLAGGNTVTISGGGFCTGARVYFENDEATVVGLATTQITVDVPPGSVPGYVNVLVLNPNGSICYLLDAYEYR